MRNQKITAALGSLLFTQVSLSSQHWPTSTKYN